MTLVRNRVPLPCGHRFTGPRWANIWTRDGVQSDEDVIEEVFIQDAYGLRGMPTETWGEGQPDPATVIDLGANIGAFSIAALQFGASRVVAVEPEAGNLAVLTHNVAGQPHGWQVETVAAAVGPAVGVTRILGEAGQAHVYSEGEQAVTQTTLADIIDGIVGRIGVLKCDVEGAEYEIIDACPAARLARCERISMEWHGPAMAPWRANHPIGALVGKLLQTHDVHVYGLPDRGGHLHAHAYPKD